MNYIIKIIKTNYDDVEEDVYQNEAEIDDEDIDDGDEEEVIKELLKEASQKFSK